MRSGRLAQVGTPGELYHKPNSSFVADFIGHTNLLPGEMVSEEDGKYVIETKAGRFIASANGRSPHTWPPGADVIVSIRPEQMQVVRSAAVSATGGGRNRVSGKVLETTFLGEASEHVLAVGANAQRVKVISAPPLFDVPAELAVEFDPEDVVVLSE
jgi:spermidine/putrescine transport system ATP-binding protein